jgi:DNA-binding LacI/PurR family transcriptional regulator
VEGCSEKLTIKDIAAMCGVSVRTVSRVLNKDPNVKESTRAKVQEVITAQGFQPSIVARSLRRRKSNTIVIFMVQQEVSHWSQYHPRVINGFVNMAHARGYHVVISYSNPETFEENENDGFYLLRIGYADAALVLDTNHNDRRVEYMQRTGIPFIILGHSPSPEYSSWVRLDDRGAGAAIGRYLLERNLLPAIGFFGGENFISTEDRLEGILSGLGMRAEEFTAVMDCRDMEQSYRNSRGRLKDYRAAFVSGDERVPGVYRAAAELGLRIPDDLAVIGFDDSPLASYLNPPLTTVRQPYADYASQLVDGLSRLLADASCRIQVTMAPELIERGSTPRNPEAK